MPRGTIKYNVTVGGITIGATMTREADGVIAEQPVDGLPAGKAGTLTTRTSDTAGIVTVLAGHGITDADTVDVYWDGGVAYGFAVSATASTTITIETGAGDVLPTDDPATDVVITPRVEINVDFDGDDLTLLAVNSTQRSHVEFEESDGTTVKVQELLADEPMTWHTNSTHSNPLTGEQIGAVQASNGTVTAAVLKIVGIKDSVA